MDHLSDKRARLRQEFWNVLHNKAGNATKQMVEGFMEAERDEWIACRAYQRSDARQGYRNGYYNRTLDTRHGTLRLRVPRVRSGDFQSCVYDLYKRRSC